jgi:hypothetical protein
MDVSETTVITGRTVRELGEVFMALEWVYDFVIFSHVRETKKRATLVVNPSDILRDGQTTMAQQRIHKCGLSCVEHIHVLCNAYAGSPAVCIIFTSPLRFAKLDKRSRVIEVPKESMSDDISRRTKA